MRKALSITALCLYAPVMEAMTPPDLLPTTLILFVVGFLGLFGIGLRARPFANEDPELRELTVALLEAPPESIETQHVMQLLDRTEILFAEATERLRSAKEASSRQTYMQEGKPQQCS